MHAPPPRRPGRPRSDLVTAGLIEATITVLVERGYTSVNTNVIANRACSGKTALRLRWPSVPTLVAAAVIAHPILPAHPVHGSFLEDLHALLLAWTQPLDRAESAAAAIMGHHRHEPELEHALQQAVVLPLDRRIRSAAAREDARSPDAPALGVDMVCTVMQAVLWHRLAGLGPTLSLEGVDLLLDDVLLPAAGRDPRGSSAPPA